MRRFRFQSDAFTFGGRNLMIDCDFRSCGAFRVGVARWRRSCAPVGRTTGVFTNVTGYFVLLSSRKLLYYESDQSNKQRGTIELPSASCVRLIADEFYNYEDAFEIVTKYNSDRILAPKLLHFLDFCVSLRLFL